MIIRAQWKLQWKRQWKRQWKQWTAGLFGAMVILGLGVWILFLQPLWLLTSLSPLICSQAVYAIATDQPIVALTIDDGPDISSLHYQTALGTIWPYDTHLPSVAVARQQILRTVHPGAIIILHDSGKREGKSDRGQRAVQILQTVLPELQARGYTVTTLSGLASYGPVVKNQRGLPQAIDRAWQRAIASVYPNLLQTHLSRLSHYGGYGLYGTLFSIGFHLAFYSTGGL